MVFCLPYRSGSRKGSISRNFEDEPRVIWEKRDIESIENETEKVLSRFSPPEHDPKERIDKLRALIQEKKVDYYVVPSGDEHQSEYTAPSDERLSWLTGFNGSVGTAIVERDRGAWLFVDSRYWIQAGQQVSSDWEIVKLGDVGVPKSWTEWLQGREGDCRIGIDPKLISATVAQSLSTTLEKRSSALVPISSNLIDEIRDVPERSLSLLEHHPHRFSGRSTRDKLSNIRATLFNDDNRNSVYILPVLPAIAWLLNLRCVGDIEFTPVFFSYVVLSAGSCALFVDDRKISEDVAEQMKEDGVEIKRYGLDNVIDYVKEFRSKNSDNEKGKVLAPSAATWALARAFDEHILDVIDCPVDAEKAVKNDIELEGFRNAYLRDGLAYVRWMYWLQDEVAVKGNKVTEWQAGDKLREIRTRGRYFRGLAYDNIVGYSGNGALPHYSPVQGQDLVIGINKPLVVDSGAQYLDGTIDTTRTLFLGKYPSREHQRTFTRVLQGHISLETTPFPEGSNRGYMMDSLARQFLFKDGLNYGHGTGHGIGQYLSVHEGPQTVPGNLPLKEGQLISNEPGFYKPGYFGIRIESVLICKKVQTMFDFGGNWLGWERITVVPIEEKLIDWTLLSKEETQWVRDHNQRCKDLLVPLLTEPGDDKVRKWLTGSWW